MTKMTPGNGASFLLLFFPMLYSLTNSAPTNQVATYWTRGEMGYLYIDKLVNQSEALAECLRIYKGRLLTILNVAQDDAISDMIVDLGISHDIITSGKINYVSHPFPEWEWSTTATLFPYRNWSPSSPDFENHCCFKGVQASNFYRWRSLDCDTVGVFICEM